MVGIENEGTTQSKANSVYRLMIEEAEKYQCFKSKNERDILDFPLHVPMGMDVHDFLEDTFDKYYQLLEHTSKLKNLSWGGILN